MVSYPTTTSNNCKQPSIILTIVLNLLVVFLSPLPTAHAFLHNTNNCNHVNDSCNPNRQFTKCAFTKVTASSSTSSSLSAVQTDPRTRTQTTTTQERHHEELDVDEVWFQQRKRASNNNHRSLNTVLQELAAGCRDIRSENNESQDHHEPERTNNSEQDTSQQHQQGQDDADESSNSDETDTAAAERRKLAARAALLGSRTGSRTVTSTNKPKSTTSVGARRVGSASKARQGPGMTERIMDAVRKSAGSNTSPDTRQTNDKPEKENPSASAFLSSTIQRKIPKKILPVSGIHAAVVELMERQRKDRKQHDNHNSNVDEKNVLSSAAAAGMWDSLSSSLPGLYPPQPPLFRRNPPPGTILVEPKSPLSASLDVANNVNTKLKFPDCVTVRVATPRCDTQVAQLRLSVFSDFSPEIRRQLVSRSVQAVVGRRLQGATCLIATVPPSVAARKQNRPPAILGSAEVSFHEFDVTTLGKRRPPQSILYVTEVAVSPTARRRGIGAKLLEAIDVLANMRGIETLYLHVDVENEGALALYEKAGYRKVDNNEPMFLEFTTKLNLHDGATKGRNHFLLYKDLVPCPTWLPLPATASTSTPEPSSVTIVSSGFATTNRRASTTAGALGFEVPAC